MKAKAQEDAEIFVGCWQSVIFKVAHALSVHRRLDEDTAKDIFYEVVDVEIPQDLYETLKILPHVMWESY